MIHNKLNIKFAGNFSYLRMALGLMERGRPYSQEEIAAQLSVVNRTISMWEQGRVPPRTRLIKIADFFSQRFGVNITPEDLLYRDIRQIITIKPSKEITINEEEIGKLQLLKDFEMFARENLTEKDIETLIKIAKLLKERGEL